MRAPTSSPAARLAFLTLAICPGLLRAQPNTSSVEGWVSRDCQPAASGQPAHGARVTFRDAEKNRKFDIFTDSCPTCEGRFAKAGVEDANYAITVRLAGYKLMRPIPNIQVYSGGTIMVPPNPVCLVPLPPAGPTGPAADGDDQPRQTSTIVALPDGRQVLRGMVSDGKNPVAGAQVTLLENVEGGQEIRLAAGTTNKDGLFELPLPHTATGANLSSKEFIISIARRGYATATTPVEPGDVIPFNHEVQPESEAPRVQRTDVAQRSVFGPRLLQSLPLGTSRSFDRLALLSPGVALAPQVRNPAGPGIAPGIGAAGAFSSNGLRARENNFMVNGSDNNDEDVGVRRQGFVSPAPQPIESLREVQFVTLLGDGRFVRNIGGHVNVLSQSGGEQVHGQVYGLFTSSLWNSRDYFDRGSSAEPGSRILWNDDVRDYHGPDQGASGSHQFIAGFFTGFAVSRSTFLSVAQESRGTSSRQRQHFAVPRASQRGLFGTGIARDVAPRGSFLPASLPGNAIFSLYPFPNNLDGPFGANTYTAILPGRGSSHSFSSRLDRSVRTAGIAHSVAAFGAVSREDSTHPAPAGAISATGLRAELLTGNFSVIVNTDIGPRGANSFRYSIGATSGEFPESEMLDRDLLLNLTGPLAPLPSFFTPDSRIGRQVLTSTGLGDALRTGEITGQIGQVQIAGFSPIGYDTFRFPQMRDQHTSQFSDTFTRFVRQRHTLVLGFDIRRVTLDMEIQRGIRPLAAFSGLRGNAVDMDPLQLAAAGIPTQMIVSDPSRRTNIATSLVPGKVRKSQIEMFANESWRINERMLLTIGGRIGISRLPKGLDDRFKGFEGAKAIADLQTTFSRDRVQNDLRLGMVWDGRAIPGPLSRGRTIVRAGFGIYTGQVPAIVLNESRGSSSELGAVNTATTPYNLDARLLANPTNLRLTAAQPRQTISDVFLLTQPGDRFKVPYAYHYGAVLETLWGERLVTNVGYAGTMGRKLLRITTPDLGPGRALLDFRGLEPAGSLPMLPVVNAQIFGLQEARVSRTVYEGTANSGYHSLQAQVRRSYSTGVQVGAAFTWSRAIDEVSDFFDTAGAYALPQSSFRRNERGSANFDAPLRLAAHFVWDIMPRRSGPLHGWQVAGIYAAQSGQPYSVNSVFDVNRDGNLTDRPDRADLIEKGSREGGRTLLWLAPGVNPMDLLAPAGQDGRSGRNAYRARGQNSLDVSLSKLFPVSGKLSLLLRIEAYNAFNRTHFGIPVRLVEAPGFGASNYTAIPNRILQLLAKFQF